MVVSRRFAAAAHAGRSRPRRRRIATSLISAAAALVSLLAASPSPAEDFVDALHRIDRALKTNPGRVSRQALDSCLRRRQFATLLYDTGFHARAKRGLRFCFQTLRIPSEPPDPKEVAAEREVSMARVQARAAAEVERALKLEPDVDRGLEVYRDCALCHMPEGWGLKNGTVPQIAGQHWRVVIKQLADIRAGHRDAHLMLPYATVEVMGGTQSVADVAGYIDTLEISTATGKGAGTELELGEQVYSGSCARCHGARGEGNPEIFAPRIQAQHYNYLVRQIDWMRQGKRRNADAEMIAVLEKLDERQTNAALDWVSRLEPPEELQAPEDWLNPDFANWERRRP